ncbi:molecular chaperone HtpG [Candidatus Azobacteroides pseudotrichonymphae]|jgi:molecular chaperone HtpG|uniref:Chaperone protein HtpG n=1 Tax=Azobacteroides pseudotrichonymphae genomovar. CFP2 TaxID=511995 RepID=B6YQD5_AZOPC|nr:molecular chaperone HtpG [Candidatus Azobacteroides pseudotrichonymphae]BAG83407.1 heat shock protein 90 [Candidatus Azobacteroides pseudotrichonymphae genomovar. CFP2]
MITQKQTGHIGVTTENIFPIIKKFLYSDHEIFLRELVSNAVDATQKLKTLVSVEEVKGDLGNLNIRISIDEKEGTLTVSDRGVGLTADEIEKYINQIAFSGASDFLSKYKDNINSIIGHFGLGFYSSFMVSKKVEIITKSWKEGISAVKWECDGSPEYTLIEVQKETRGTDVILHMDEEGKEFLEKNRIDSLLKKYCRFLPIPIVFGKKIEWKDGKSIELEEDNIINNTNPLWVRKPSELTDEDYTKFYQELYPFGEIPLFWIHLNVDYPFNLTGILYFPKVKSGIDLQKNKIQLYCNQVYVTDSVEGIVPEFLTLLHGVIDSPDIPLNVSRSYLQSDSNVKKISTYITKKVSDRLDDIFKNSRLQFEEKWSSLRVFIHYGMITDEKFCERAMKFVLLENTDKKFFTLDEYKTLIEGNQTDKDKTIIYLYTTNQQEQYAYVDVAKEKAYNVLVMDGQLDNHFMNTLERKLEKTRFVRVDADVIDNLIKKSENKEVKLTEEERKILVETFKSAIPSVENADFVIGFEHLGEKTTPITITQNEFMRRMKEMAGMQSGMNFYGGMPISYTMTVNLDSPLVKKIDADKENTKSIVGQLVDLALLSNGLLKGEALNRFIKRNIELIS